ncbi:MAG: hypothetical protein R3B13_21810 [Polyangiaceae bacterium]
MRQRLLIWSVAAMGVLSLAVSCSATSDNKKGGSGGGSAASSGGGSGGTSASGGIGNATSGGTGAIEIDAALPDSGDPDAACESLSQKANKPAVDIIWVVDNSCSMGDEIAKVRTNINQSFVPTIDKSIIDWQVIMVSKRGTSSADVCVEPPLAGTSCADKAPKFHQVSCEVASSDSLTIVSNAYTITQGFPPICDLDAKPWNSLARFDATKVFVEVTDDEAGPPPFFMNADGFDNWALNTAKPTGMFGTAQARKYIFHAIIGMDKNDPNKACNSTVGSEPTPDGGVGGNAAVAPGLEYQKLAKLTGGITRSICEDDWSDIFNTIAAGIVNKLSCEYVPPPPPGGKTLDPAKVNVNFTPSAGNQEAIFQDNNKPCDQGADGWQWDASKTKILLCGNTCDKVKADENGQIDIEFGCATKVVPPPR